MFLIKATLVFVVRDVKEEAQETKSWECGEERKTTCHTFTRCFIVWFVFFPMSRRVFTRSFCSLTYIPAGDDSVFLFEQSTLEVKTYLKNGIKKKSQKASDFFRQLEKKLWLNIPAGDSNTALTCQMAVCCFLLIWFIFKSWNNQWHIKETHRCRFSWFHWWLFGLKMPFTDKNQNSAEVQWFIFYVVYGKLRSSLLVCFKDISEGNSQTTDRHKALLCDMSFVGIAQSFITSGEEEHLYTERLLSFSVKTFFFFLIRWWMRTSTFI